MKQSKTVFDRKRFVLSFLAIDASLICSSIAEVAECFKMCFKKIKAIMRLNTGSVRYGHVRFKHLRVSNTSYVFNGQKSKLIFQKPSFIHFFFSSLFNHFIIYETVKFWTISCIADIIRNYIVSYDVNYTWNIQISNRSQKKCSHVRIIHKNTRSGISIWSKWRAWNFTSVLTCKRW